MLTGSCTPAPAPGEDAPCAVIAHRGASHDAPENTLAAVRLAWERQAGAVEIDVFLTRDGAVAVIHDANTKKLAGVDREVADQTLAELKALDVGRHKGARWAGERVPELGEVLATVPEGGRLFVELKSGPEIVPALVKAVAASGLQPRQVVVISFNLEAAAAAKRALPGHEVCLVSGFKKNRETGAVEPSLEKLIGDAAGAGLDGLDLQAKPFIDRAYIARVKAAGLTCYTWTVNDPDEARRLRAAGIDGITTDRPGFIREALGR